MFDVAKIIHKNKKCPPFSPKLFNKAYLYKFKRMDFGISDFSQLVSWVHAIERYDPYRLSLQINLGNVKFQDKLSYVLLECLCLYLIDNKKRAINIKYNVQPLISTDGIMWSPLSILTGMSNSLSQNYLRKFRLDIGTSHYRRVVRVEDTVKNPYYVSSLVSDIATFLKPFDVSERYRNELAEVLGELVDNSIEHANADCLLDLDISREFTHNTTGAPYHGVNAVVMNISDRLLGDMIKGKIKNGELLNDREIHVKDALESHQRFFDEAYTEEDFFCIASFQDRVSGRNEYSVTGGTGLTKLISSLEERADTYDCYVLTGNKKISFSTDCLKYTDGWIGFNTHQDYFGSPPDEKVITPSPIFFPGTAYNLCFAMKKEDISHA